MSVPTSISTAFERARRYQALSRAALAATGDDPTLSPECPPYETEYGSPHVFAQSGELADIAGFYRAFGLAAPATERVDHLAVELEFLSFLAFKEAWAVNNGETERTGELREIQAKFLADHLARWAPAFATRFEARDAPLAGELRTWIRKELAAFGIEPSGIRPVDLRPAFDVNEPMDCGGGSCGTPS